MLIFCHQNAGQNDNLKVTNKLFENSRIHIFWNNTN